MFRSRKHRSRSSVTRRPKVLRVYVAAIILMLAGLFYLAQTATTTATGVALTHTEAIFALVFLALPVLAVLYHRWIRRIYR